MALPEMGRHARGPWEPEAENSAVLLRHNRSILNPTQKQVSRKTRNERVYTTYQRLEKNQIPSLNDKQKITSIFLQ